VVSTGGDGVGGGFFAASRLAIVPQGDDVCVFASNAGSSDIAGISAATHTVTGNSIGIVQLTSTGTTCTLTEVASSPIVDNSDASNLRRRASQA
jgi:hypothetical protein